jgi:serine/threonine-protein kinase
LTLERLRATLADRYRLERELGQGGMATVYLAEDLKHARKVAIKVLHPELSAIIGGERFLSEIRTTASLQHPHILGLIDSGEADRLLYYVMPFVSGESLRGRLTREKQLPVNDAIRLAKEVAGALDYAHRQGVIHRDIKPENILLQDGSALVADFGIALAVQQAAGSRMTQTGMSLGTPAYMSPEQAMGERDIGARSDVYALGAMTYEMLTGEPPFTGVNSQAIVAKVLTEAPPLIRSKRPTVGAGVEDAVLTALQKLPADRFGSAREFAEALDGTGSSGRYAATVALPRATRGRRSPVMVLAAFAIVAALAGAVGWRMRPVPIASSPAAWQDVLALPDSILPLEQPSLSPDGTVLAFSASSSSKIQVWIRRADASSPVPLPGSDGCMTLAFSPDGKRIACQLRQGRLVALPLNGGPAVRIADSAAIVSNATWLDDDHVVYASSSGLLRTTSTGGAVEQWTTVDTSAGERYHAVPFAVSGGRGMLFVTAPALMAGVLDRLNIAWVGPKGGKHVVLMRGSRRSSQRRPICS